MFHWVPTMVFDRADCWGEADAISVPANFYRKSNEWGNGVLQKRGMNNKISSALVPPGYKLDLYDETFDSSRYSIIGKMRDDGTGIYCHSLKGMSIDNKTSLL